MRMFNMGMMMAVVHPLLTNPQASPSSVSKSAADGDGAQNITTDPVTASADGGTPGHVSYSWSRVSGSSSITANSASSATTTFTGAHSTWGTLSATFRCTITDTISLQSVTVDVPVQTRSVGLTPTLSFSPANHTFSRSGTGNINASVDVTVTANGVGPYTAHFTWVPDDGIGLQSGGPSSGLTSPITLPWLITLTSAPYLKTGTLLVDITDETTGAVANDATGANGQST